MPTVLRVAGYRFFFYSNEGTEPSHIHAQKAEKYAKFWLQPVRLADAIDCTSKDLRQIQEIIEEHLSELLEEWYEHFA